MNTNADNKKAIFSWDGMHLFSNRFTWIGYLGFMAFAIFLAIRGDMAIATTQLCMSIIFDPFGSKKKFAARPFWQRLIIFLHFGGILFLFGLMLWGS